MYNRLRLGEMLVQRELVTQADVERALKYQRAKGGLVGSILVELNLVSETDLARTLAEQLDCPFQANLELESLDLTLLDKLKLGYSRDMRALPIARDGDCVLVATDDPLNMEVFDEVRFLVGTDILPVLMPSTVLTDTINRAFELKNRLLDNNLDDLEEADSPADEDAQDIATDLIEAGDDDEAPVIRFVNGLFKQSVRERASDIHIEPGEQEINVRFRIDGVLKSVAQAPKRFHASVSARIKIMAGLNIAEKRLPQDGRIRIKMAGKDIDIRVATAPMVHGERITMRLLDKSSQLLSLKDIGFANDQLETIRRLIRQPHGIILVTGPTGSGKTTTLYSGLSEINTPDKNILTIEDPVEYQLAGISQMQVNSKIDLTFASGLRSYLRHDPDVIMIGEIRDEETAKMAIQASLTGHLVLSTLHTNDASGAFTRLTDMGVEPFLVSSTVIGTMAQRLVRCLCPECKEGYRPDSKELSEIGLTPEDLRKHTPNGLIYRPKSGGCETCNGLGYKGRTGIYEMLAVDDPIKRLVMAHADSGSIKKEACNAGMRTLREDGAIKVLGAKTSIAEIIRVTSEGAIDEELLAG